MPSKCKYSIWIEVELYFKGLPLQLRYFDSSILNNV